MGYFKSMDLLVPSLAALIASLAAPAATAARGAERVGPSGSPATRYDSGASATVTVSARILRSSARVGAGQAPPPRMVPRRTTVSAADGRLVAALVYDFE